MLQGKDDKLPKLLDELEKLPGPNGVHEQDTGEDEDGDHIGE